ncbi:hypothetical protein L226DRAFT_573136 [Lentinus tigrinus ALCF2SS1-7]|uniref:uncharacterized protein n=1 Tax=Lentinus tigrinus ALCF2SS1-7 TaxID=1328758 RepID=UPI00116639A4|nr:hypothetical protein L226DRAFT_573136 [Lentinus tigrinus ALCF2SS1-7]
MTLEVVTEVNDREAGRDMESALNGALPVEVRMLRELRQSQDGEVYCLDGGKKRSWSGYRGSEDGAISGEIDLATVFYGDGS